MGDYFTRIGKNILNHELIVRKGNVSGSATSTGSFGKVEGTSFSGDGSALSNIIAAPWESTSSFYNAVSDIHITGSLSVLGNISGSFGGLAVGQKYLHEQSSAATTWTISHNFDYQYVNVDVYDGNDQIVIPTSITATDSNTITLTFGSAVSGNAIVSTGGQAISARGQNFLHSQSTPSVNWRVTHSIGDQYPTVTVYDDNDNVIIPQQINAASVHEMDIVFTEAVSGNANISVGGGIPSGTITGSAQVVESLPSGTVSSSAQIASDISGSFIAASSSFSTRVSAEESNVDALQSDSGSFSTRITAATASISDLVTDSGSFSTRITQATASIAFATASIADLVTDSGSFSTRITNATSSISALKTDSGSFSTRVAQNEASASSLTTASSSFSTRMDNSEASGALMNQDLKTSASPTFVNVTATGTMTAQEFHTEFVSASIVYTSGSTKFGDTIDDTHQFSGSQYVSGSVTATSFTGIFSGALSSSAQIATDISGSFTAASSSFSTRVARNEASASSLTTDSSSFSTRITDATSSIADLVTDSGSFSTRITNATASIADLVTDSGSFSTRITDATSSIADLVTDSGSFSTRITAATASISGLVTDSGSFSTRITQATASIAFATASISALKTDSGSFSTRITQATASISALKTDSGSFSTRITQATASISALKTDSGSFSTRIAAAESELGNTLISSSAQIASDISGSFSAASSSLETNKATKGFTIAMSVAL